MRKIVIGVITVSLAIIALVMSYRLWADYQKGREAETALANIDANKPSRFIVDIPVKSNASSSDSIVVLVDSQGKVKLNGADAGKINETEELRSKLTQLLDLRADKTVMLRVPRAMKYSDVTNLIDAIKKVGGEPVGLQINDS